MMTKTKPAGRAILLALLLAMVCVFSFSPVPTDDWLRYFRPAALQPIAPYAVPGSCNPPWVYVILYPVAALPVRMGVGALYTITLLVLARYVEQPRKLLAVLAAAPVWGTLWYGQIDALVLVGLMLPATYSLPMLLVKPQSAAAVALRRLNWRSGAFLLVFLLGTLLVWGYWPARIHAPGQGLNASLFSYSVPVGILALWLGWRWRSDALLCAATLCCSPYWQFHSMLPTVAAGVRETRRPWQWALICLASWAYVLVRQ